MLLVWYYSWKIGEHKLVIIRLFYCDIPTDSKEVAHFLTRPKFYIYIASMSINIGLKYNVCFNKLFSYFKVKNDIV